MRIKGFIDEDFINYQKPSAFISTAICDWKCCKDYDMDLSICQNSGMANQKTVDIDDSVIYNHYVQNPITKAIVLGGLERMLQFKEVYSLIRYFREHGCNDPFVIYTGYNKNELHWELDQLRAFRNIIVKFGRYVPGQKKHFDKVLGVELASNNQYAEVIS